MFNLFKNNKNSSEDVIYSQQIVDIVDLRSSETTETTQPADEWIEIIGYKGMDENMRCRDGFQYKLGGTYIITEPSTVEVCKNGYHLCKLPEETFNYYHDFFEE